ncbi:hypothetical protein EHZ77_10855 [Aeromonas dhakensis]|nr:hypothetical protein EHZ77_10855 [Aeromonas dhakensis]
MLVEVCCPAIHSSGRRAAMRDSLKQKIIQVCQQKIAQKGETVGVSFYAFFANRNDDPELLMEAATWWIQTQRLDHFEKARKILQLVEQE